MNWLDLILDRVSKFGKENITKLEKEYLDNYHTKNQDYYELQLGKKFDFYKSMYFYELEDVYWFNPNMWVSISDDVIKETRLNMLWDNMEWEDSETFMKIYEVPNIFLNLNWNNVPIKYQKKFESFWNSYYNFNI